MQCSLAQNAVDSEEPAASIFRAAVNSSEILVIYLPPCTEFHTIYIDYDDDKALLKIDVPVCGQMSKSS